MHESDPSPTSPSPSLQPLTSGCEQPHPHSLLPPNKFPTFSYQAMNTAASNPRALSHPSETSHPPPPWCSRDFSYCCDKSNLKERLDGQVFPGQLNLGGNLSQTHLQVCFLGDAESSQASKEDSPLTVSLDHSKTTVASFTCTAVVWFTLPFCAAQRHLTCPFRNSGWKPPPTAPAPALGKSGVLAMALPSI